MQDEVIGTKIIYMAVESGEVIENELQGHRSDEATTGQK
jgi:hypothetical protein